MSEEEKKREGLHVEGEPQGSEASVTPEPQAEEVRAETAEAPEEAAKADSAGAAQPAEQTQQAAEEPKEQGEQTQVAEAERERPAEQGNEPAAAAKSQEAQPVEAQPQSEAPADPEREAKLKAAAEARAARAAAKAKAEGEEGQPQSEAPVDPEREAKLKAAAEARAARAAAKAKAEAEAANAEPEPPKEPSRRQPDLDRVVSVLNEWLGAGAIAEAYLNELSVDMPTLVLDKASWTQAAPLLRDHPELRFNYLRNVSGVDYETHLEVVYHLLSLDSKADVAIKLRTDREEASIPSATPTWSTANWNEREIYDLLGIHFTGHPDLRRIMMPDDWVGHPLRKDYEPLDSEV